MYFEPIVRRKRNIKRQKVIDWGNNKKYYYENQESDEKIAAYVFPCTTEILGSSKVWFRAKRKNKSLKVSTKVNRRRKILFQSKETKYNNLFWEVQTFNNCSPNTNTRNNIKMCTKKNAKNLQKHPYARVVPSCATSNSRSKSFKTDLLFESSRYSYASVLKGSPEIPKENERVKGEIMNFSPEIYMWDLRRDTKVQLKRPKPKKAGRKIVGKEKKRPKQGGKKKVKKSNNHSGAEIQIKTQSMPKEILQICKRLNDLWWEYDNLEDICKAENEIFEWEYMQNRARLTNEKKEPELFQYTYDESKNIKILKVISYWTHNVMFLPSIRHYILLICNIVICRLAIKYWIMKA